MAFQWQPASSLQNCTKLTLSIWAGLPAPAFSGSIYYSLLEFGGLPPYYYSSESFTLAWVDTGFTSAGMTPPLEELPDPNQTLPGNPLVYIWVGVSLTLGVGPAGLPIFQCRPVPSGSADIFVNPFPSWSSRLFIDGSGAGSYKLNAQLGGSVLDRSAVAPGLKSVQKMNLNSAAGTFGFGVWHHVFVSADIGTGGFMIDHTADSLNGGSKTNKFNLIIDGVNVYGGNSVIGHEQDAANGDGGISNPPTDLTPGILVAGRTIALPYNPNADGSADNPIISDNDDIVVKPSKRQYSTCQGWIGTYTDPSDIGLFIDASGKPVDPATAEAALGPPTFRFRRSKKKKMNFTDNQGDCGQFSLIGTAPPDFTPGPEG